MRHLMLVSLLPVCCLTASAVEAQALRIAQVSSPRINCAYNPSCEIVVEDDTENVQGLNSEWSGVLRIRTTVATANAPLAGSYGYLYRLDLQGVKAGAPFCVQVVTIHFRGPIVPFAYNADGMQSDGYVITDGGIGHVGPATIERRGDELSFQLPPPFVCSGGTSLFFGFTSTEPPHRAPLRASVVLVK